MTENKDENVKSDPLYTCSAKLLKVVELKAPDFGSYFGLYFEVTDDKNQVEYVTVANSDKYSGDSIDPTMLLGIFKESEGETFRADCMEGLWNFLSEPCRDILGNPADWKVKYAQNAGTTKPKE